MGTNERKKNKKPSTQRRGQSCLYRQKQEAEKQNGGASGSRPSAQRRERTWLISAAPLKPGRVCHQHACTREFASPMRGVSCFVSGAFFHAHGQPARFWESALNPVLDPQPHRRRPLGCQALGPDSSPRALSPQGSPRQRVGRKSPGGSRAGKLQPRWDSRVHGRQATSLKPPGSRVGFQGHRGSPSGRRAGFSPGLAAPPGPQLCEVGGHRLHLEVSVRSQHLPHPLVGPSLF